MKKALRPFWIYFGTLVTGCILFFLFPLVLFLFFPALIFLVPIWFLIAGMIGSAVQQKIQSSKLSKRIALSVLCSFLIVTIFPICSCIDDFIRWKSFHFDSFLNNLSDIVLWIVFFLHCLAFWIGEEIGRLNAEQ